MVSAFVREQKRYSQEDLCGIFQCNEENAIPLIRKLKEFGILKAVKASDIQKNMSDLLPEDIEVADVEIGENDSLSALVAELSGADLLLILSDIDALYDGDPRENPDAKPIPLVEKITPEIEAMAGGAGTSLGTGGMSTKINAAKIATNAGIDMIIMNGRDPEKLYDLFEDKEIGTLFKSQY